MFLFGFSKSELDNVADDELEHLQLIASQWLTNPQNIAKDVLAGILIEVVHDNES